MGIRKIDQGKGKMRRPIPAMKKRIHRVIKKLACFPQPPEKINGRVRKDFTAWRLQDEVADGRRIFLGETFRVKEDKASRKRFEDYLLGRLRESEKELKSVVHHPFEGVVARK